MGVENNEAVIATTWDDTHVDKVKDWVSNLPTEDQQLFAFIPALINSKTTVVLGPDGSKKGWETAAHGNELRDSFISFISPLYFDWVEVGYGEYGQSVLRGNNCNCYTDTEYYQPSTSQQAGRKG